MTEASNNVIKFPQQPPRATAAFPSLETLQSMTQGKPLKTIIVITVNTDNSFSHYVDGAGAFEATGMLEAVKMNLIASNIDIGDGYDDDED